MDDETPSGSAGAPEGIRYCRGGDGEPTPLQSRANFLKNWDWASVTQINARLCERGHAQHGINRETHQAVAEEWDARGQGELSLLETLEFLQRCHRRAPFLFFNGNTFAEIGRALGNAIFSDLHFSRKKEISSAIAHFITGVLSKEDMASIIDTLWQSANLAPGDRVTTLRGSLRGQVIAILDDGRIKWSSDTGTIFTALPESLIDDR